MAINLTLRSEKTSPLTFAEMDSNLQKIQDEFNRVSSIPSISKLLTAEKVSNKEYFVTSYHDGWAAGVNLPQGGGVFVWDEFRPALQHNGITVIDPSKTFPTSWTNESQKQDWYFSQNAGVGCFVRKDTAEITSFISGCKSDQLSDDTKATQAGVNSASSNRLSYRVCRSGEGLGLTLISSKILINSPVRIHGDGFQYCGYVCVATSAFEIAAGVNNVSLENFFIGQAVRYSTTPNTYVAVKTLGTDASRNFWHNYDRLFIDGFYLPFDVNYLWSTTFTKIVTVFCFGGIYASGVSVNDTVSECFLGGCKAAGSVGIKLGDGTVATEGWLIDQSLIAEFAIGVNAFGCSNSHLTDCILDFFQQYGVFLQSSSTVPSLNWTVSDNYIATDNVAASTGILMTSNLPSFSDQNRGHEVHNNQILKYSGANLAYGIAQNGLAEGVNIITNNRVAATEFACKIFTGANTIVNNNYWKTGSYATDVVVTLGVNVGG